jgi:hypothetical protein
MAEIKIVADQGHRTHQSFIYIYINHRSEMHWTYKIETCAFCDLYKVCCTVEALILDEWKIPVDLHLYSCSYNDQYIPKKVAT